MIKYKFVDTNNPPVPYKPEQNISYYYQVAIFFNKKLNGYHIRKFFINSDNDVIDAREYILTPSQFKKFIRNTKPNIYRTYSVYSLYNIQYPHISDILLLKSNILSKDHDYTGYAPIDHC